jgi:predicted ArsR family transcriptional regulator
VERLDEGKPERGRRGDVLDVLHAAGSPLGVAEVAARLGVHPNTVRFHLSALLDAGQVELVEMTPGKPGRPPSQFRARPVMDPGGPRNYLLLAEMLASQLVNQPGAASVALEAGRGWGRRLAPEGLSTRSQAEALGRLVDLLGDLGFAPEPPAARPGQRLEIALRHCPFLDLAGTYSAVICPLHLGLMQGALEAGQSPVTVERLDPFAAPDRCLAQVAPARATGMASASSGPEAGS